MERRKGYTPKARNMMKMMSTQTAKEALEREIASIDAWLAGKEMTIELMTELKDAASYAKYEIRDGVRRHVKNIETRWIEAQKAKGLAWHY